MNLLWREVESHDHADTRLHMLKDEKLYRATLIREWWSQIKYRVWLLRGKPL